MSFFKKVFVSASTMPAFHIGLVLFLMGLAGIKALALSFLEIGATQLYLTQTTHRTLGIDLIAVSVMSAWIGYEARLLKRRQGYGAGMLLFLLLLCLAGIIALIEYHVAGAYDVLFIAKYIYFGLVNVVFWSVCSRFLPITSNSLKFIFVLAAEAVGYALGGGFVYLFSVGPYGLIYYAMALLMALLAGIHILTQMKPVAREMFILPTGEVQDFTERKMVRLLLMFCFFVLTAFGVMNYVFYTDIAAHYEGRALLKQMALWWLLFGSVEFVLSFSLIRRRFFYLLSGNMFVITTAISLTGIGILYEDYRLVFAGFLVFMMTFYVHFNGFVETLFNVLRMNGAQSLNKKRLIVIEPTGFMLGALCVYYLPDLFYQAYVLLGLSFLLFLLLSGALYAYSKVLLNALKLREWRGTPLMMASQKVFTYIRNEIAQAGTNDVIYFLRILETSKHPSYMKILLKSLKHPSEDVRLFAVERIRHASDLTRYRSAMQFIFKTDKSIAVRRRVLAVLIQIADMEEDTALLDSYAAYLDNRSLRSGAMIGFLTVGGSHALLAMDGLQKMASSTKISDKLLALDVIEQAPSAGLIRLLMPLLKSTNPQIANAALWAAGAVKHAESLPIILSSLDDIVLQENALTALKKFGIKAYPLIERTLHNTETGSFRQKILILFLTMRQDIESKQILLRALKMGNQKLKKAIIRGMIDSGIFWIHKDKYVLMKQGIMDGAQRILTLNAFCDKYKQVVLPEAKDAFSFLIRAIGEDIAATRELIFYQLLLMNKSKMFRKAVYVIMSDNTAAYPIALGVLQDMLRKDLYKVVEQMTYLPFTHKKEVIPPKIEAREAVTDLLNLFMDSPFYLSAWIRAGILHCLRKLGDVRGLTAVHEGLKSKNSLVLEAAVLALYRLEEDEECLNETLLTVPTSSLVSLQLDTILKG